MLFAGPAFADSNEDLLKQMQVMQKQIDQLQKQLAEVQKKAVAADKTAKIAAADATVAKKAAALEPAAGSKKKDETQTAKADAPVPGVQLMNKNNIKLTLGGFVEAAGIYRTKSESTDMASNFSTGIPFPYLPGNHLSEFRESARQSRLSLLAQGDVDPDTKLAAYFESDFLGAAVTANSNETNSYTPRIRQIYSTLDENDMGLHVLVGQAWSLLTMNKTGITERQENVPLTIEAQYVPGFTFTRNPQLRLVKDLADNQLHAGLSLESPQALVYNSGINPYTGSPTFAITGTGTLNTTAYTTDLAPDMIAKLAYDPGYGHYEVYGIGRFFRDRNHANNSTIMGGGAGAGAILPIISKKLEFQISGLAGTGIGRYGAAQLPDVTLKPDGGLATINEAILLAGLTAHPDEKWDVYLYGGTEREQKRAFTSAGLGYGYGNPLYNNSGCNTEGQPATSCVGNTSSVDQIAAGFWWKFYKGSFGTMQFGAQDSYTTRNTFSGIGGSPSVNENVTMVSLRYYPF